MGHVADVCQPTSHDDLGSYDGGDSEVKNDKTGHWRAVSATAWEQDPKRRNFQKGSAPARGRQPGRIWNRLVPRRPEELCETQPRGLERPSRARNPGTSTKASKTSARRGTRRSPMLAHETSPVSGASVMEMT
jgi:hypothetical protein